MRIRRMRRGDDSHDLISLSRAFFAEYEEHHEAFFQIDTLTDEAILDYFALFLENEARAAFIALLEERMVGYVTLVMQTRPDYWRVQRVGHVSGLMVDAAHRRQGIGTRLMEEAQAYFREHGLRYYTLYTSIKNSAALAFYERQGMEPLYSHLLGDLEWGE